MAGLWAPAPSARLPRRDRRERDRNTFRRAIQTAACLVDCAPRASLRRRRSHRVRAVHRPWRRRRGRDRLARRLVQPGSSAAGTAVDRRRSVLRIDPPASQSGGARGALVSRPGQRICELSRHGPCRRRQDRADRGQGGRRCLSALRRGCGHQAGASRPGMAVARRGAGRARPARPPRSGGRQHPLDRRGQGHHRRACSASSPTGLPTAWRMGRSC